MAALVGCHVSGQIALDDAGMGDGGLPDAGDAGGRDSGTDGGDGGQGPGDAGDAGEIGIGVAAGCQTTSQQAYASVPLRGYGALAGEAVGLTCAGGPVTVLAIATQDAAHAALTQAKYVSDLGALSAATPVTLTGGATGFGVAGQGTVVAFAAGASVVIVAGEAQADVTAELAAITDSGRTYAPSVTVPMYLDRWDKHGFNFYYAPFSQPAGYDYTQDFDYAAGHGGTGFVVESPTLDMPNAEGQMGLASKSWAIQAAAERGLPIIFNDGSGYPTWLLSQYRGTGDLFLRAPGFSGNECGTAMSAYFEECVRAWDDGPVEQALLGVLQQAVRTYATEPNVISILEPHGELSKGVFDQFVNYGPAADTSLQAFLQSRYPSVQAVDTAWYGGSGQLTTWSDVHAPALDSFAGHDQTAFDITGPWRALPGTHAASGTAAPPWSATTFDDSAWALVDGDDNRLLLPLGATALRAQFTPTGFSATGSSWLYVWPVGQNCPVGDTLRAFLNGTELAVSPIVAAPGGSGATGSWAAFQVGALSSGAQTLALSIPPCTGGYVLGYQTYLSKTAPALFPSFSATENQRYVDFEDWLAWTRGNSVADGMNMIRQVDLDKPIELMAPNIYTDVDKTDAQTYGGTFHDTGFMSGFWIDELPAQMRSAGMPFSLEPPSPASDAPGFQSMVGNWLTEGVNGVSYFQNIVDVTGNPAIEAVYQAWRPMLGAVGKYHGAPTDVAQLFSARTARLMGVPWGVDANRDINGGSTSAWALGGQLEDTYDLDAVTERDFAAGNASKYKVIVDANTSFMDVATISELQTWIEAGGTFITYVQTGRNSPAGANTWPISQLSGYSVASIDPTSYSIASFTSTDCTSGSCTPGLAPAWTLSEAPGQAVLPTGWAGAIAAGLHLTKVAPEAQDVLLWPDGTVAVGMRPLGAGRIFTLGATFVTNEGWRGYQSNTTKLIEQILVTANARTVPGSVTATAGGSPVSFGGGTQFRHFLSNDGLYDVWVLRSNSATAIDVDLTLSPTGVSPPTTALDVIAGSSLPLVVNGSTAKLAGIALAANQTRMFVTARNQIAQAPQTWFELQRGWWQGTTAPSATPYPAAPHRYTVDLSATYPMGDQGTSNGWSQTFSVPATWTGGSKVLWVEEGVDPVFFSQGSVQLDGTTIWPTQTAGPKAVDVTAQLTPGTTHTLAVQSQAGSDTVSGVRGEAWIRYLPTPKDTLSLAGTWTPAVDGYTYAGSLTLPGAWVSSTDGGIAAARRTIDVPASWSGTDIVLYLNSNVSVGLGEVIVNGQWVHGAGTFVAVSAPLTLNLTSLVVPGATNTIEVFPFGNGDNATRCASTSCVESIELQSYAPGGVYP